MQERLFGVDDERVGDPEQLHQPPVQAQALVALEDETLVGPALTEEDGGGVVLQQGEDEEEESFWPPGLNGRGRPGGSCRSGPGAV